MTADIIEVVLLSIEINDRYFYLEILLNLYIKLLNQSIINSQYYHVIY